MNTPKRIRDVDFLKDFLENLRIENYRYYLIVLFALYTGLRVSDILLLHVGDVRGKKVVDIIEKKTRKSKTFALPQRLIDDLSIYIQDLQDTNKLFNLTRDAIHKYLNHRAKKLGYSRQISMHSLRKTFGRMLFEETNDITIIQKIFNHSSAAITRRYIELDQDEINDVLSRFDPLK